jgi:ubiquinone/menaquinone biosynthesis C-methylase UbiE
MELTIDYIMEDPREALRLEQKFNPEEWLAKYVGHRLFPGAEVLSVGCGPGATLRTITELCSDVRATGLDISPTRLRHAAQRNAGNCRVQLACGDAHNMQFAANSFDFVYTRMLLQYASDKERVVHEMARVCKRDGTVMLQDLDGQMVVHYPEDPSMQRALDAVMAALAPTGFDPFVGRKLFWLARNAGLENIKVQVEPYHLIAGEADATTLEQWSMKLEIARPCMVDALGSEHAAEKEIRRFMDYLKRPDTLTYSNVFTITGRKPS